MRASEKGYSLTEALVILAIIGLVSVITVPAFIGMSHQNRAKAAMGQFTADLRNARQRAVTNNVMVKISFAIGTSAKSYTISESTSDPNSAVASIVWTAVTNGTKTLDKTMYLASTNFTDIEASDSDYDIVFRPSGSLRKFGSSTQETNVVLRSEFTDIAKKQYTITFGPTGNLTVQ